MTRRSFFAAVAGALVAARAPRLAAGGLFADVPVPGFPVTGSVSDAMFSGFFHVGDVLTFGADPREYVVTAMSASSVDMRAVVNEPGTLAWRRDQVLAMEGAALSASTNDASPIALLPGAVRVSTTFAETWRSFQRDHGFGAGRTWARRFGVRERIGF